MGGRGICRARWPANLPVSMGSMRDPASKNKVEIKEGTQHCPVASTHVHTVSYTCALRYRIHTQGRGGGTCLNPGIEEAERHSGTPRKSAEHTSWIPTNERTCLKNQVGDQGDGPKGVCHKSRGPDLGPQDSHNGRTELTLTVSLYHSCAGSS